MKSRWPFLICVIALSQMASCDTENSYDGESDFTSDTLVVLNYFDEVRFENDTLPMLLKEIGICDPLSNELSKKDACSPRNYKFFKFNSNMPWNEGFGLEIRATVDSFPLRRFIVFERTGSELVKIRGFVANLAEMHTTVSGFNDLMLLFPDREAGSFVVKFVYNLQEKNYEYESLEAIDGYPVKKERKDSLSNVVLQRLTENNMFF
jgi:hypothetical protein